METGKEWPPDFFASAIKQIIKHSSLNVIIAGHHRKLHLAERIDTLVNNPRLINLMGKTSLLEAFDLIGRSRFVLCNDSFPLHAANAMQVPLLCVTQGLNKGRYLPYPTAFQQSDHHYVYTDHDAMPMNSILPDQVKPALEGLLNQPENYIKRA